VSLWFGITLLLLGSGDAGDPPPPPPALDDIEPAEAAPPPEIEQPPETPRAPATAAPRVASPDDESPDRPRAPPPPASEPSFMARYAPAPVDGPGLRLPDPVTQLYVDASYGRTADLSGLPLIAGRGKNLRFAVGGTWRWKRLAFDAELPFSNVTTLDVTLVPGIPDPGPPAPQDAHQTATSLGDLRLGLTWSKPLTDGEGLVGGFGVRLRAPTHTVVFQFHLADMVSLGQYRFPYYFHVEPTLILGGAAGRFSFVVNQGLLLFTGPDGNFQEVHIIVPNLLFWSAHYAVVYAPVRVLGFSVDLGTDIQLNHVDVMDFQKLNDIVAASLDTGIQIHLGPYRIDLVGRFGLTKGAELFGVLQYAGTESFMVRFGRRFD
jgi:hypothetical protein